MLLAAFLNSQFLQLGVWKAESLFLVISCNCGLNKDFSQKEKQYMRILKHFHDWKWNFCASSERSFWRRKCKGERTSFYHLSKESVLIWCAWDLVCVRYTNNAWRSMTSFVRTGICILAFLHQNESELFPLQRQYFLWFTAEPSCLEAIRHGYRQSSMTHCTWMQFLVYIWPCVTSIYLLSTADVTLSPRTCKWRVLV